MAMQRLNLKVVLTALLAILGMTSANTQVHQDFNPERDINISFQQGQVVVTAPSGVHLKKGFMGISLVSKPGTLQVGTLPPAPAQDELGEDIYRGTVKIPITGKGLKGQVKLAVEYQACTEGEEGTCFPPTTKELTVKAEDIPASKGSLSK